MSGDEEVLRERHKFLENQMNDIKAKMLIGNFDIEYYRILMQSYIGCVESYTAITKAWFR